VRRATPRSRATRARGTPSSRKGRRNFEPLEGPGTLLWHRKDGESTSTPTDEPFIGRWCQIASKKVCQLPANLTGPPATGSLVLHSLIMFLGAPSDSHFRVNTGEGFHKTSQMALPVTAGRGGLGDRGRADRADRADPPAATPGKVTSGRTVSARVAGQAHYCTPARKGPPVRPKVGPPRSPPVRPAVPRSRDPAALGLGGGITGTYLYFVESYVDALCVVSGKSKVTGDPSHD
jgi:hypothetical protein